MSAVAATPALGLPAGGSAGSISQLTDDVKTKLLITEDHFDLTVDVDSEIEESLGADFWESDWYDPDYDPDLVPPLDRDYVDDQEEFKAYYERARTAWTETELYEMKDFLRSKGMEAWLKEYVIMRREPLENLLFAFGVILSKERRKLDDLALLPLLKAALARSLRHRHQLSSTTATRTVIKEIRKRRRIMVLTGAGISVSCGIPDFRSRNGLYSQLFSSGIYDLDDPQQMFDINYFKHNPSVFYSFAHKIYPSNFSPSACHRFIKALEDRGKLLRNYTQNIDTLETKAGIKKVLRCHGSFATATCINCRARVPGDDIKDDLLAQRIPLCKMCNISQPVAVKPKKVRRKKKKKRNDGWESDEPEEPEPPLPAGIMKPDITFFGEKLTKEFDKRLFEDIKAVDMLLIIGTSLKVRPVSEILTHIPHHVPVFVINKTPLSHIRADLLGDADTIVEYLARKLEWDISPPGSSVRAPIKRKLTKRKRAQRRKLAKSGVIMFDGAEGGKYVANLLTTRECLLWESTSEGEDADSESEEPMKKQPVKRTKSL